MMYGSYNILAAVAIWGWPVIAIALFLLLPPRRALVAGFVLGWLFLPFLFFETPFIAWNKQSVTSIGALLGVLLLDSSSLTGFRFRAIDIPMICWLVCLIPATLTNTFAPYSAIVDSIGYVVVWGVPYFLGRVYFGNPASLRGLAVWIFIAGLLYVPFCLYEIRMSPVLSAEIYGFSQHVFDQSLRYGGYRPMVFMQHGLAVGMMMAAASLAGIWLMWTGSLKRLCGLPTVIPMAILLATTVLVKSAGALVLLAVGVAVLFLSRYLRTWIIVTALCAAPVTYMLARGVGHWSGSNVVNVVAKFSGDRAASLQFRLDCEGLLVERASIHPAFGWGVNGNFMVTDVEGNIISVPDGFWVIALGTSGLFGLVAIYTALLLPSTLLALRVKSWMWSPAMAGAAIFAVILPLHAIDNLFNAMLNPLFVLGLGGLASVAAAAADPRALLLQAAAAPAVAPAFPVIVPPRPPRPSPVNSDPFTDGLDADPAAAGAPAADTRSIDEELGIS
jgi:hypothetical protein